MKPIVKCAALLAAAVAAAAARAYTLDDDMLFGMVPDDMGFKAYSEIGSGYISSSGNISDTRPVAIECVSGDAGLGDYGEIGGYVWTISKLHGKRDATHRRAFYEFEMGVWYGYDWRIADGWGVDSKIMPMWDVEPGVKRSKHVTQELQVVQSLENPYLTPYYSLLYCYAPNHWFRVRMGVRRSFKLMEGVSLAPGAETVYSDARRYETRYGHEPESRLDGFSSLISYVTLKWDFAENWNVYFRIKQYDLVGSNARAAVRRNGAYYSRTDYTIYTVGVGCSF